MGISEKYSSQRYRKSDMSISGMFIFRHTTLFTRSQVIVWFLNHLVVESIFDTFTRGGFQKAIYALCLKFVLCAHPLTQIYSNLTSCICAMRSTNCIFSQILVGSMLHTVGPTFLKSTPVSKDNSGSEILWSSYIHPILYFWPFGSPYNWS
jgi:hypothetical protein